MVTQTDTLTKPLTDDDWLAAIEKKAHDLWHNHWDAGSFVLYAVTHSDMVPGATEFTGQHRITVSYTPSREYAYWYRDRVFDAPTPLENREEALITIGMFRQPVVRA